MGLNVSGSQYQYMPSGPADPLISVVIPFGTGLDLLREQILSIFAQDYEGAIDLIISCNMEAIDIRSLKLPSVPARINVVAVDATQVQGPSHARNVGWKRTISEFVLFCDADDRVDCRWVSAMACALTKTSIVGGRLSYEALNDAEHASWNFQTRDSLPRKFRHLEFAPSSNLGVHRKVLDQLSGFDEDLVCGEDIDFCWRAQYAGFQIVFASEAVVQYRLRPELCSLWKQSVNYGASDAALLGRHEGFGARRPISDSLGEAAAIGLALMTSIIRPSRFKKAIVRAGMLSGRIQGSLLHRKWAV